MDKSLLHYVQIFFKITHEPSLEQLEYVIYKNLVGYKAILRPFNVIVNITGVDFIPFTDTIIYDFLIKRITLHHSSIPGIFVEYTHDNTMYTVTVPIELLDFPHL